MLADGIIGRLYPARFKQAKSGDIFWLVDRQQLRLDQWMSLDSLHGQGVECVWVNWELYAELTSDLTSEERSGDEKFLYP
jgi:tripartite-type tricarboxylate transporter receptor subunit TctC